jgi:hypothetical protein
MHLAWFFTPTLFPPPSRGRVSLILANPPEWFFIIFLTSFLSLISYGAVAQFVKTDEDIQKESQAK